MLNKWLQYKCNLVRGFEQSMSKLNKVTSGNNNKYENDLDQTSLS